MTTAAGKPLLWLPDTSSLLSLAVDDDLIEDYNGRIKARNRHISAVSIHKLLSQMVHGGRLAAGDAEAFAGCLVAAGRAASSYTADEFRRGDLGRVGRP